MAEGFGPTDSVDLAPGGMDLLALTTVVRDVQGPEFAAVHRAWIETERPTFVPGVAERIAHALAVTPEAHTAANEVRTELRDHLAAVLEPADVVVVPLAGRPARRDGDDDAVADARRIAASLSVVGSLGGLPTVAIPAVRVRRHARSGSACSARPGATARLLTLAAGRPPVPSASGPAPA